MLVSAVNYTGGKVLLWIISYMNQGKSGGVRYGCLS